MADDLTDILAHPCVEYAEWVEKSKVVQHPSCCESLVQDALRLFELCGVQADTISEAIITMHRRHEAQVARIRELEMTMTHRRELSMDW